MRKYFYILILLFLPAIIHAQTDIFSYTKQQVDSMYSVLKQTDIDNLKMELYQSLGNHYLEKNKDSALYFAKRQQAIAIELKQPLWQGRALDRIGYINSFLGNYPESLKAANKALKIAEDNSTEKNIYHLEVLRGPSDPHKNRMNLLASIYFRFSILYFNTGNLNKAHENILHALRIAESMNDTSGLSTFFTFLASWYEKSNKQDSALYFLQKALIKNNESESQIYQGGIYNSIGRIYLQQQIYETAKHYFQLSGRISQEQMNYRDLGDSYSSLADLFLASQKPDSALFYGKKALEFNRQTNNLYRKANVFTILSSAYQIKGNTDSAYFYLLNSKTLGDSLSRLDKERTNQYQNLIFEEQIRLKQLEEERESYKNKIRTNSLLGGLFTLMIIAFSLYRNNRQKQKAKQNIEKAYTELKATQTQLVQSEKMASLGELTAGIAHEIQNPLNFVNNFSEVSTELLYELKEEIENGNNGEVNEIIDDVVQNLEKINHHGKRAEAIVKGMLQHSRGSSGKKELTDINALADEFLRLSYHGLRAKNKSFNADFKLEVEENIPKINVVPQDIGRVLLNLINNAFYAVTEKAKQNLPDYKSAVTISIKNLDKNVEIRVKDNGNGIPESVKDKIFQPFFTTKPTGEGTGLGLSMSYDIITKSHNGTVKVETKEGIGTEFIITIPITA